jgi:hypothetical protein
MSALVFTLVIYWSGARQEHGTFPTEVACQERHAEMVQENSTLAKWQWACEHAVD